MNKLKREKTQTYPPRMAYAKWTALTYDLLFSAAKIWGKYPEGIKPFTLTTGGRIGRHVGDMEERGGDEGVSPLWTVGGLSEVRLTEQVNRG
jgi:hypothetical protein